MTKRVTLDSPSWVRQLSVRRCGPRPLRIVGLLVVVHVGDNGLGHADLVGGQAHGVLEGGQGVQEVLGQRRVLGRGGGAGLGEDGFVVDEVLDHGRSFLADA